MLNYKINLKDKDLKLLIFKMSLTNYIKYIKQTSKVYIPRNKY